MVSFPEFLYWEFHERGFEQAVRMGRWKAVRHGLHQPIELYDLETDIKEQRDIAAQYSSVVKRIEEILQTVRTESEDFPIHTALPISHLSSAKQIILTKKLSA
jgi:arylsulfatase A-like enzyme